jgi:hypothetical protein
MSAPEVLRRITTALENAGIAYMLTGSRVEPVKIPGTSADLE